MKDQHIQDKIGRINNEVYKKHGIDENQFQTDFQFTYKNDKYLEKPLFKDPQNFQREVQEIISESQKAFETALKGL